MTLKSNLNHNHARRSLLGRTVGRDKENRRPRPGVLVPSVPEPVIGLLPAAVLTGLPFLIIVVLTFNNSPDDALITARYARNVLSGLGPVYNAGERVEGFSSPLHLLLTVGVVALPGGLVFLKLKLLSLLFGLLTLPAAVALIRAAGLKRWAQAVALLFVGGSWNLAVSATNGLETSLVVFLTTLLAAALVRGAASTRPVLTGIVAAALATARPESVLIIGLFAVAVAYRQNDMSLWRRFRWLIGPAVTVAAVVAARLVYYGELVPNTYFAKELPLSTTLQTGLRYFFSVQPFASTPVRFLVIVIVALEVMLLAVAVPTVVRGTNRHLLPVVAVVVGQAAFILQSGGDWMQGGRFLAPMVPSLAVLLVVGLAAAITWLTRVGRRRAWRRAGHGLVVATVIVAVLPVPLAWSPIWRAESFDDRDLIAAGNLPRLSSVWATAPGLLSCLGPGDSVAFSEAGYLAWARPDVEVLDVRGLTNATIAKNAPMEVKRREGVVEGRPFDPSTVVGHVLQQQRPELILSISTQPQPTAFGEYQLLSIVADSDEGVPLPLPLTVYRRSDVECALVQ